MRALPVLLAFLSATAFAQGLFSPPPNPQHGGQPFGTPPPGMVVVPAYPATLLPSAQPAIEMKDLPATVIRATEIPKPVSKQCLRESTAPCRDDAARMCKQLEIASCD